jgi:hypothetical protein
MSWSFWPLGHGARVDGEPHVLMQDGSSKAWVDAENLWGNRTDDQEP